MLGQVRIDRASPLPVYVQLAEQTRLLVRRGALGPGDPLPTATISASSSERGVGGALSGVGLTARELAQLVDGVWKEVDRER